MKKIALFYNPVSGGATFKKKLDFFIEAFQKRNMLLIPYRTQKENNDAFYSLMDTAKPEGVIAAGGDGTLSEVVNLMMAREEKIPIGIIGSGTSNDFATYLRVNEDLDAYFDAVCEGKTRPVDLGVANGKYFVNVASAGMLTGVAHEVKAQFKNSLGKMAYYLKGLGEIPKFKLSGSRAISLHIEADGKVYDEDALLFVVINSPAVASMKNVAASAKIDDGKLDFLAVKKCNLKEFMKIFKDLIGGKSIEKRKGVLHIASDSFYISSSEELQSDLDGEEGSDLPLTIKTVHNAVEFYTI